MLNFAYHNPVRLVFGRGAENETGRLAQTVGRTCKALVIYGGWIGMPFWSFRSRAR